MSWCSASQRLCSAEPQRNANATARRCRAEGFLEEILPPVPASLPQRYVPSARVKSTYNMKPSSCSPIQISACLARWSTAVGNLPLSSHTRTGTAEDLLSQDHRVRTRRGPAKDHVRSVEVLFFLAYGREVLFERNRPSNLDMFPRARS